MFLSPAAWKMIRRSLYQRVLLVCSRTLGTDAVYASGKARTNRNIIRMSIYSGLDGIFLDSELVRPRRPSPFGNNRSYGYQLRRWPVCMSAFLQHFSLFRSRKGSVVFCICFVVGMSKVHENENESLLGSYRQTRKPPAGASRPKLSPSTTTSLRGASPMLAQDHFGQQDSED